MEDLQFEAYTIKTIDTPLEINFEVHDEQGYVCRLVPGYAGFELSAHDKAMGNHVQQDMIAKISNYIVSLHS